MARVLDKSDLTATAAGTGIGTVPYFAPEQFEGKKHDIDPRTDLFAFGIILHEALLARHPFLTPSIGIVDYQEEVCRSNRFLTDPSFAALSGKWRMLIQALLEKQRVRRPRSAILVKKLIDTIGE